MSWSTFLKGGPIERPRPVTLSELADRVLVAQHEYDVQLAKHYADMQDAANKLANRPALDPRQLNGPYAQPEMIEAELRALTSS